eukprot:3646058-Rhodomonas_salina.1
MNTLGPTGSQHGILVQIGTEHGYVCTRRDDIFVKATLPSQNPLRRPLYFPFPTALALCYHMSGTEAAGPGPVGGCG